jgi:glutamyl-tRNA synthetase
MSDVRTRFAPSPTGFMHIGNLRSALYEYAFIKNKGGRFILRIEDTDRTRFVPGATEKIYEILKLFGLNWDELYIQSERVKTGIYQKYAEKLVKDGHAYYCFCPPESKAEIEASHQKKELKLRDKCHSLSKIQAEAKIKSGIKPAIRLRVPDNETVSFYDFVLKKEISWKTKNIDEVMLLKSDGFPTYHLGVVVDDAEMKISHIIRGRDWLPSTPIHLLLFKYLGFKLPEIGHLTDILDPAGGKLSKRNGAVSVEELLALGYLPEALLNFIMLLGWAPKDNREIFSLTDFVKEFDKGNLQTANPVFNRKKLDWFNGYHIRQKSDKELATLLKPFASQNMPDNLINKIIPIIKERMFKLSDFTGLTEFLIKEPKADAALLTQKGGDIKIIKKWLTMAFQELEKVKSWQAGEIEEVLRSLAEQSSLHVGKFFMAIRIAVTGKTATPPLFESMVLLGREKTLQRLGKINDTLIA